MHTNAERQKRFRARQRSGVRVFRIEADEIALAEALIRTGRISIEASGDADRMQAALAILIREIIDGRVKIS